MDNSPHPPSQIHDWLTYLAHDFKVPLEHIRQHGLVLESLAADKAIDHGRLLEIADGIRRELREVESLRSGIVDHLDLDSSEPVLEPTQVDILVLQVADRLEMDADLKNIELDYQTPPMPCYVQGDAKLLSRAFQNVILNAIENTPRLGFVGIEVGQQQDYIRISVSDTGSGIPGHILEKLHGTPSRRDQPDDVRSNGRGLGLAFVRRVVDLHRGRVCVEAGVDGGTSFVVELPASENS